MRIITSDFVHELHSQALRNAILYINVTYAYTIKLAEQESLQECELRSRSGRSSRIWTRSPLGRETYSQATQSTKPAFPRFTESLCRILPVQFPSKLPESPVSGIIMNQIHCIPLWWVWDSLRHGGDTLELALDRSPRAARTINAPAALETPHRRQLSSASARVVRCLPWCAQHMNATALKILKGSSRQ